MYTLYYSPGTCSLAPHVVLRELDLPYELKKVSISEGENRKPEYLAINPRGAVPVLFTPQGQRVREGAAILVTLLESKENALLPHAPGPRAAALEWLMFANATLHPVYSAMFFWKHKAGAEAKNHEVVQGLSGKLQSLWDEVENQLGETAYLAGEEPTVADILTSVIAGWNNVIPLPAKLGPKTLAMVQRITARPTFQAAMKEEGISHDLAKAA